ncbi:hypothetical protein D3C84_655440 [compost metagenome]
MLGLGVQHGGVGPTGGAFFRDGRGDWLLLVHQAVDLIRPGTGGDHAFVLEVAHLHGGVVPVAVDQRLLGAQQIEHGLVLGFGQFVRALDAQFRLGGLQVQRRVGDVDRAVIGLHATLVRLAVRQVFRVEQHAPAGGRGLEHVGVVHQHVRAPLIRGAIGLIVDHVPRRILEARVEVLPVRDQRGVDRLHTLADDQTQGRIAGCRHQVVTTLGHQADHFIGSGGGLDVDLAPGLFLEAGDPVVVLVAFTAFDIARPGHDIQLAFTLADRLERLGGLEAGAGEQGGGQCAEQCSLVHVHGLSLIL